MVHIPVLQKEVIKYLDPKANENFIDCTIGAGGHTLAILERNGPRGKVLGMDQDPEQIKNCKLETEDFKNRVILVWGNFVQLKETVKEKRFKPVKGILFDLGMSNWHLKESSRGFSFLRNEPLDMRYNPQHPLTAEKIVNYWSKPEIERVLKEFGEEKFAAGIANQIIEERKVRPIKNTFQLVEIIKRAIPVRYKHQKIHPATRAFQALRIAVNNELNNLEKTLPQTVDHNPPTAFRSEQAPILKSGGRLVVISFHSLEDRIVKNFLKEKSKENILKVLTKKPIIPNKKEIKINPRSRSAKLRAAEKI